MPSHARRPCRVGGCPHLRPCPVHLDAPRKDTRPPASARGYGWKWKVYRKRWFDQHANSVCACGCGTPITLDNLHLDHIIPVTGPDDPLFWSETNHQPLIKGHHSRKTASQDGGFGNPIQRPQ